MVSGKYSIVMKTPMGAKKGLLVMDESAGVLSGSINVKDRENRFEGGTVTGDEFSFSGVLNSSVGKMEYSCAGKVEGDKLTATAVAKRGTLILNGTRI